MESRHRLYNFWNDPTFISVFFLLSTTGCSEISCIHAKTSTTSPPRIIMPFVSRSHYEPPRIMPYQQKSPPEPSSTSVLVSGSQLPSRVHQPLRDPSHGRACPCFSCRFHVALFWRNGRETNFIKYFLLERNSGSIFSTPSYFPQSSESGEISPEILSFQRLYMAFFCCRLSRWWQCFP